MIKVVVVFLLSVSICFASNLRFNLLKKGKEDNNTLLVVGGIQGDEPGGFNAATLIYTHYTIKKGSVWIVPNLNFLSIVKRGRGLYGDMNRKFANLPKDDPEYEIVQEIKNIIKNKNVSLIVNLHDGSGFYRENYINKDENPYKWGQSNIIDQCEINASRYSDLYTISKDVVEYVNRFTIDKKHIYHTKNTKTKEKDDKEMKKSLTYFAINQNKPAFGNEASKNLPTHLRVYYHLLAVERYMQIMGIEYERDFQLTPKNVKDRVDNAELDLSLYNQRIRFAINNIKDMKKNIYYIPIKKDSDTIDFSANNPLIAVTKNKNSYKVSYDNRRVTYLHPQYFEYDYSINSVDMQVDGVSKVVPIGTIITVNKEFLVKKRDGYRVNIIGYSNKNKNEAETVITKKSLIKKYSVDKKANIYRVEIYKDDKFSGMVLVKYEDKGYYSSINVAQNKKGQDYGRF